MVPNYILPLKLKKKKKQNQLINDPFWRGVKKQSLWNTSVPSDLTGWQTTQTSVAWDHHCKPSPLGRSCDWLRLCENPAVARSQPLHRASSRAGWVLKIWWATDWMDCRLRRCNKTFLQNLWNKGWSSFYDSISRLSKMILHVMFMNAVII